MDLQMVFKAGGEPQALTEADREKVAKFVRSRVGGMTCPDHQQLPTITVAGSRLDEISFHVEGCCQKVIYLVKTKLAE